MKYKTTYPTVSVKCQEGIQYDLQEISYLHRHKLRSVTEREIKTKQDKQTKKPRIKLVAKDGHGEWKGQLLLSAQGREGIQPEGTVGSFV